MEIVHSDKYMINCIFQHSDASQEWLLTCFHVPPEDMLKIRNDHFLDEMGNQVKIPWIMGYLNIILSKDDRLNKFAVSFSFNEQDCKLPRTIRFDF